MGGIMIKFKKYQWIIGLTSMLWSASAAQPELPLQPLSHLGETIIIGDDEPCNFESLKNAMDYIQSQVRMTLKVKGIASGNFSGERDNNDGQKYNYNKLTYTIIFNPRSEADKTMVFKHPFVISEAKVLIDGNLADGGKMTFSGNNNNKMLKIANDSYVIAQNCKWIDGNGVEKDGMVPRGGAVYVTGFSTFVAINCEFNNNQVLHHAAFEGGGAIKADTSSDVHLHNCNFFGNRAPSGGAVALSSSNLKVIACSFIDNWSSGNLMGCNGGAIRVDRPTKMGLLADNYHLGVAETVIIHSSKFKYNTTLKHGNAIEIWSVNDDGNHIPANGSIANLVDCTFTENGESIKDTSGNVIMQSIKDTTGTVIIHGKGNVSVEGCLFKSNYAGRGAGIFLNTKDPFIISQCAFYGNHAKRVGGALALSSNTNLGSLIEQSSFFDNRANEGGAINMVAMHKLNISSSTFGKNISESKGGAIYMGYPLQSNSNLLPKPLNLIHCTLAFNISPNSAAVFRTYDLINVSALNCIFAHNGNSLLDTPDYHQSNLPLINRGGNLEYPGKSTSELNDRFNNWTGSAMDNNKKLTTDPLLNFSQRNGHSGLNYKFYKPQNISPVIDKALNLNNNFVDMLGNSVSGISWDIGAVEQVSF